MKITTVPLAQRCHCSSVQQVILVAPSAALGLRAFLLDAGTLSPVKLKCRMTNAHKSSPLPMTDGEVVK